MRTAGRSERRATVQPCNAAVDHDSVARLDSCYDREDIARQPPHFDRGPLEAPLRDLPIHHALALGLDDGGCGHGRDAVERFDMPHLAEHLGPEPAVAVGELGPDLNGAGLRVHAVGDPSDTAAEDFARESRKRHVEALAHFDQADDGLAGGFARGISLPLLS